MKKMKTTKAALFSYMALAFFALLWILPIYTALTKSFSVNGLANYAFVLNHPKINYFRVIFNSVFMSAASALVVVIITTLAAFAFSKMKFPGQKIVYYLILACLAIPAAAVTVPLFFSMNKIGFLDTYQGVIIPLVAFNAPFMLMMVKNYFDGIPNELLEAAKIDGYTSFPIYAFIMLPLSVPIIATVGVLTFVYCWNDYLIPLLMIRSEAMSTVTLASRYFMETTHQTPSDVARVYAALILMTIPSVVIYLFSQKYLQSGVTAGAVKS